MSKVNDLTGQTFGRLTVLVRAESDKKGQARWLCRCECGKEKIVYGGNLTRGLLKSCGCLRVETSVTLFTTHGQIRTRLYKVWGNMKSRTTNPRASRYRHYGGRGITVCEEWRNSFESFRDWALASGYREGCGLSIDRIDNDGNYEPGNCRWVDGVVQANNKSRSRVLTVGGESHTMAEWGRKVGISSKKIHRRIKDGWSPARAIGLVATT